MPPISNLDHSIIYCHIKTSYSKNSIFSRKIWLYDEGNYDLLNNFLLAMDWNTFFYPFTDINEVALKLTKLIADLTEICIPSKIITNKSKNKPCMTGQVLKLFRQAKTPHKRAKRPGNVTHYDHFKLKRSEAKAAFKLARDKYYVDIADKLADPNTSSNAYWRLTKLAYGQKAASGIPYLLEADRVITDDERSALR